MRRLALHRTSRLNDKQYHAAHGHFLLPSLKAAGKRVIGTIIKVFTFIDNIYESMNRARAESSRFSGSQW
jgi:hypothetical protein